MGPRLRKAAGLALTVTGFALAASGTSPVGAAPDGKSKAKVGVGNTIAMSGLTASFTLEADPSETVAAPGAVQLNVKTNNPSGYVVSVKADTEDLTGADANNPDTIPVSALLVTSAPVATDEELDASVAKTVGQRPDRTSQTGDTITNDYEMSVPWVNADTYSVSLDYIAAAR
jgi:hypothetical protein